MLLCGSEGRKRGEHASSGPYGSPGPLPPRFSVALRNESGNGADGTRLAKLLFVSVVKRSGAVKLQSQSLDIGT